MKKLLKSRRGVAIEMAVGVMFLMIGVTIILMATSGLQNKHRVDDFESFNEMVDLNNIGEYVVANRAYFTETPVELQVEGLPEGYSIKCLEAKTKFEIYRDDTLCLTIVIDTDGNIISWN